ncbi:MAG: MBL fold metallo-hydrolase [Acidimicrobiales bacterium]|jgi:glyoxylase-like metal-dependent hydrolase (beta-lactamase superfamily II)
MAMKIDHYTDLGEFEYGSVDQVTPGVRRVICKNPNPFTFRGTGTYIIGRGEVAVVDPGPALDSHVDDVLAALEPGERVTHILVTHTHSDHSTLVPRMKEMTGALSYGYGPHGEVRAYDPNDKVDFSAYITAEEKQKYDKEWDDIPEELKREGADVDFVPDVAVRDGDVIDGGNWTVTAVHTPGHCSNHICFAYNEEKALFSGDHVMGWATSVVGPPDGSMKDYMDSLRKLLDRDDEVYWPTHGPAIPEPRDYVAKFIAHRTEREDQIVGYLGDRPKKIADFIPDMYAAYDKRLWYPAAGSAHAHMLHLYETGKVTVVADETNPEADPKLTATYQLA